MPPLLKLFACPCDYWRVQGIGMRADKRWWYVEKTQDTRYRLSETSRARVR